MRLARVSKPRVLKLPIGLTRREEVGEIALIVKQENNRGEWKKGKVVRLIEGKDGFIRGVTLSHKGNNIERPLQLVYPLEMRAAETIVRGKREQMS